MLATAACPRSGRRPRPTLSTVVAALRKPNTPRGHMQTCSCLMPMLPTLQSNRFLAAWRQCYTIDRKHKGRSWPCDQPTASLHPATLPSPTSPAASSAPSRRTNRPAIGPSAVLPWPLVPLGRAQFPRSRSRPPPPPTFVPCFWGPRCRSVVVPSRCCLSIVVRNETFAPPRAQRASGERPLMRAPTLGHATRLVHPPGFRQQCR